MIAKARLKGRNVHCYFEPGAMSRTRMRLREEGRLGYWGSSEQDMHGPLIATRRQGSLLFFIDVLRIGVFQVPRIENTAYTMTIS